MKLAILSNVNMNGTARLLKREVEIYDAEGYGNEIGTLMNPASSIYEFAPDIIFLVEDIMELLGHESDESHAQNVIDQWFADIQSAMRPEITYYISDVYCYGQELDIFVDKGQKHRVEHIWQVSLERLVKENSNVRIFPYRNLIEKTGEDNAFSLKMWYMGKILHSTTMQQTLAKQMLHYASVENNTPKKVLLLDLDNTLWGGLAGEDDITPVTLSESHAGLAYKNLQRVILQMKKQGVILGIVSKNNEEDAMQIIRNHPHMILREDDFAIKKINWNSKAQNIEEIASELNLGTSSMVFFDDNPTERQLIRDTLTDVVVPEFPDKPEDLAGSMVEIWKTYFDRAVLTKEDQEKTKQYAANAKREELKKGAKSFEEFIAGLDIKLTRKAEAQHVERITQLLNKTNQFNLTTKRHNVNEIQKAVQDISKKIFVYEAADRFGDNGIIAVVVADMSKEIPVIEEFVMSCRVMGKNIENAILDDVESYFMEKGYTSVIGEYIPSKKNQPVAELYPKLGYVEYASQEDTQQYRLIFDQRPKRAFWLEKIIEK